MHPLLPPAVFLVVLPLAYLAHRLGLLERRAWRWTLAIAALGLLTLAAPRHGLELDTLKRLKLLLAAAAAVLVGLRARRLGWGRRPRRYLAALGMLAAASLVVASNFFAFHGHGVRAWVHHHDVAHYYLGAKYFPEVGYTGLYTAMLRAEAELYDDHFKSVRARDLESHEVVHIRGLLQASEPVKQAFEGARWEDFKRDVRTLRERLGANYAGVLLDHGYNATPLWTAIGGTLASRVPAGSERGLLLLSLLDPLLLAVLFLAVCRAFGPRICLEALTFFALAFGAGFAWTGGAFLRTPWLVAVGLALCCLRRRRPGWAGALLALAALLRVFPALLLAGPLLAAGGALLRRRRLAPAHGRLLGGFALGAVVLFLSSGALLGGFGPWVSFLERSATYRATISSNLVGLTEVLAVTPERGEMTAERFRELQARRQGIHRVQLVTLFPLALLLLARGTRGRAPSAQVAASWLAVFAALSLASYYYAGLLALLLAGPRARWRPAWVFTGEAVLYVLYLFEPSQSLLYVYRSVVVLYLLLAVCWPPGWLPDRLRSEAQ